MFNDINYSSVIEILLSTQKWINTTNDKELNEH